MRFKYHSYLNQLPDCPPSSYERKSITAFRFVFEDLDHIQNFLPVLLKNPKRRLRGDAEKCKGYGLSFFDTLENVKRKYVALAKNFKNIHLVIGTHIAEGFIEEDDGVVSELNRDGHFTLHEFEHTDLKNKFHLIMRIFDGSRN